MPIRIRFPHPALTRTRRTLLGAFMLPMLLAGCGLRGPLVLPPGPPPEPVLGWPGGKRPDMPQTSPNDPNHPPVELIQPQQDRSGDATTPGIGFTR